MTEAEKEEDASRASVESAGSVPRVQAETSMIASNIGAKSRVAPALNEMAVIDDMYSFADRLRAGSKGGLRS